MTFELQPTFTTTMRGYDRAQVDEYTTRLRQMLYEAQERATQAQHALEAAPTQAPAAGAAEGNGEARPSMTDFDALGERIAAMLRLAEEEANDRRRRGRDDAEAALAGANAEAEEIRRSATLDIEALREQQANAQREAKAVLDNARDQAEDLLSRARRHAEDQAEGIIAQAEGDARRILDEARETAQARIADADRRRGELAAETEALEQRYRRVLDDLARVRAALDADPEVSRHTQPHNQVRVEGEAISP
jgi:cell division septum initiation protein DivIVA